MTIALLRFSILANVSLKLNELYSSVREKVFGEDYWIPSDPHEVAFFPQELLTGHKVLYPPHDDSNSDTDGEQEAGTYGKSLTPPCNHVSLTVVQGTLKNEPSSALHHVVYTYLGDEASRESLTIFRSKDISEALDFCRRCEECRVLLKLLGKLHRSEVAGSVVLKSQDFRQEEGSPKADKRHH